MEERTIQIIAGSTTVATAKLYDEACRLTAEAIWNALPLRFANLLHSRFAGEEVYFPIRRIEGVPAENRKLECVPGEISFFGPSSICIYYGKVNILSPGNVFAKVVTNWENLYRICRLTWYDHNIPIRMERIEG